MRGLLTFVLMTATSSFLSAETLVYVSTGADQKIHVLRLEENGTLAPIAVLDVDGTPGSLIADPKQKVLYASLRSTNKLASFAIDQASGKLTPINIVALEKGDNAAFLNTDRTGRYLLSASYAAGKIMVHGIAADGSIKSPAVQTLQTTKTAHCVAIDAKNHWVFVPHVAPNAVYQYHLDPATGQLQEAGKAEGGVAKAGPRHFAFHPTEKLAFTSNEENNSVTSYRFDEKVGLKPLTTLTTLPEGFKEKNTNAEVKVHPSGKFVYVSNRGHDSIAGFRIDSESGALQSLGQTPTEKTPRSFDFDSTGKYLLVGGEGTGKLAIYTVDAANGSLTLLRDYPLGKSVTWVMCLHRK